MRCRRAHVSCQGPDTVRGSYGVPTRFFLTLKRKVYRCTGPWTRRKESLEGSGQSKTGDDV